MFSVRSLAAKRFQSASASYARVVGRAATTTAAPSKPKAAAASAPKAAAVSATATPASGPLATATPFAEVKFQKEDVAKVMQELPEFSFYVMQEPVENPYKSTTLDRSILLDTPAPVRKQPEAQFSQLENGLKIASVDNQGLSSHLGLYVSAGSRWESAANFGVSHMVELTAFKSTAHLSHLRTVKMLEAMGAHHTASCTAGREDIVYEARLPREFMPYAVPMLVGNVLFPRLLPWEVKTAHKEVAAARSALMANPDAMVSELLHTTAFCNNTLGYSPIASDRSIANFNPDVIRNFMLDHFAPERMVFVGVNVDHSDLCKWLMRSFADYNAIPMKSRVETKANYTGGSASVEGASPYCHLAVGFNSVPWASQELAAVSLLQTVLGSGSAGSSSIGSGTTSRLMTQIVKQNPYVESCAAFNTSYTDSGLFGVYGVGAPDKAGDLTNAIVKSLIGLQSISQDELSKAKAMLKGNLFRQINDSSVLVRDLGQQILMSGKRLSPTDFAAAIDRCTDAQVAAAAKKLLQSKPTVVAYGDTHAVPHYSVVEAALRA